MTGRRIQTLVWLMLLAIPAPAIPAISPGNGAAAEARFPSNLSGRQQEKLLAYARGLFLARLGFGEPVRLPEGLPEIQRACFVTFFSGRRVIACFGGFQPRTANVLLEIGANVAGALRNDPRARAISRETALAAGVQITFPAEPVPIGDYRNFDPSREGLFAESDRLGVAIVPGEARTAAWARSEALRRLGEKDPSSVRLYRFRATFLTTRRGKGL